MLLFRKLMQNRDMKKKKILYYEKGKFNEFAKQFTDGENIIYPISYLTDHTIALKYTGIHGVEHFIIDITVMVLSALVRNDLRIIYEGWLRTLETIDLSQNRKCNSRYKNICQKLITEVELLSNRVHELRHQPPESKYLKLANSRF